MKYFFSDRLYQSSAPFSHLVRDNNQGVVSGIIGQDPEEGILIASDFRTQCEQTFKNLLTLLYELDLLASQILKLNVYVTSFDQFEVLNDVERQYFESPFPARSCIGVSSLPLGAKIQIDATVSLK